MQIKLSDFPAPDERPERAAPDWVTAACSLTGTAKPLERANYDTFIDWLDDVDPYGRDWEEIDFANWECAWLRMIFVRPNSPTFYISEHARGVIAAEKWLDKWLYAEYLNDELEAAKKAKGDVK